MFESDFKCLLRWKQENRKQGMGKEQTAEWNQKHSLGIWIKPKDWKNKRKSRKQWCDNKYPSPHWLATVLPHWPCLTYLHRRHLKRLREQIYWIINIHFVAISNYSNIYKSPKCPELINQCFSCFGPISCHKKEVSRHTHKPFKIKLLFIFTLLLLEK